MLESILDEKQRKLLARERRALRDLQALVTRGDGAGEANDRLETALGSLDELFLLVVVGEFNSGKSTFLNALLGNPVLAEGVTPTTAKIHRIVYGESPSRSVGADGVETVAEPLPFLRQVHFVDTPGTNALDREHEALTQDFIPRADLVLFVTSADRPFSESERAFLAEIREWGKKIVLVVNKLDFLASDRDRLEVEDFVRTNARELLGMEPDLHLTSARKALQGKMDNNPEALAESRFPALEEHIMRILDDAARVRLKLMNPLGVGRRIAGQTRSGVEARLQVLSADLHALDSIDTQLSLYQDDLRKAFRFRLSDVDNELLEFENRGIEFFDDVLRIARAFDLMNKERIRAEFERKVVGETPRRLETKVEEVIDWLVAAELEQWQDVAAQIERRRQSYATRGDGQALGELGRFDYNRSELLDGMGRSARRSIDSFDQRAEAKRLSESLQNAITGTAIVEASAVGLGTLFTVLATTQVADITGVIAASGLALVGLFILPARKRKAKNDFRNKIVALRSQLVEGLTRQFDREVEHSAARIQESIAPYSRFVRAEGQTLRDLQTGLERLDVEFVELEAGIESL